MRSNGSFISASAQITFCTFDEVLRPQIFSMRFAPNSALHIYSVMAGLVPAIHALLRREARRRMPGDKRRA